MDRPPNLANGASAVHAQDLNHNPTSSYNYESLPAASLRKADLSLSTRPSPQLSQPPSAATSASNSPFASRDPSPTRPSARSRKPARSTTAATSTSPGHVAAPARTSLSSSTTSAASESSISSTAAPTSRRRSSQQHDPSPARSLRSSGVPPASSASAAAATLASSTIPTLAPSDATPSPVPGPQKSEQAHATPRWPVSPRLRSPPPSLRPEQSSESIGPPSSTPSATSSGPSAPNLHRPAAAGILSVPGEPTPVPTPVPTPTLTPSDSETDDALQIAIPDMRAVPNNRNATGAGPTLETVQEASPLGSPPPLDAALEKLETASIVSNISAFSVVSEVTEVPAPAPSPSKTLRARLASQSQSQAESGSESGGGGGGSGGTPGAGHGGSTKSSRRTAGSGVPPPLTPRHSSSMIRGGGGSSRGKSGDAGASANPSSTSSSAAAQAASTAAGPGGGQPTMTVETETVTSIPNVAVGPTSGPAGTGSVRTRPSTETIRPKKERKRVSRKQSAVTQGTGASKADIFEAKVASAVDEANTSDSDETFVYDSNPADGRDRPHRFHHSRTPSATSLANDRNGMRSIHSVLEGGVSSSGVGGNIVGGVTGAGAGAGAVAATGSVSGAGVSSGTAAGGAAGPGAGSGAGAGAGVGAVSSMTVKKSMKFVNTFGHSSGNDSGLGEDESKTGSGSGVGRGTVSGSGRGTARLHHHFGGGSGSDRPERGGSHIGRWGLSGPKNGTKNGHQSLFDNESPFSVNSTMRTKLPGNGNGGYNSISNPNSGGRLPGSGTISPRPGSIRGSVTGAVIGPYAKRSGFPAGYDLDDTSTGHENNERTPLISSLRAGRNGRSARRQMSLRAMEQQSAHHRQYPRHPHQQSYGNPGPSLLNRCASCLVLTVMLMLVISGAIGFMFATSQPLEDIELVKISGVLASEQELMFDLMVRAHNPNAVVVTVDAADMEVFAKSPHAGTDSEWWRRPSNDRRGASGGSSDQSLVVSSAAAAPSMDALDNEPRDQPDSSPNFLLGKFTEFDNPLSFEGSFFHHGLSTSRSGVRIRRPGNGTDGGSERWERILNDEFDLIVKGVLRYSLPLSQRVRSALIEGRTTVKPHAVDDPKHNGTARISKASVAKMTAKLWEA